MTDRIKILDKHMAAKIAAGEVVERPASVVKELLENSLDAGAKSISIKIAEGGKRLISVTDDGAGMSAADALKAFLSHSTSKVATEADLEAIATLGFRGEALASISAVARVLLTTKERGSNSAAAGVSVKIEGAGEAELTPAGCTEGTTVEVRDLFFNTPARLKFLRSTSSELGRIMEIVKSAALINPRIRFTLLNGLNRSIDTAPGTGADPMASRIRELFGKKTALELIRVENPFVNGFISTHELSFATTKGLHLYVNGRPIRDRSINHAIIGGYERLLDNGRFPFVVLDILIPFADVDVNIHPAKSEVRFKNPRGVYELVRSTVKLALAKETHPGAETLAAKAKGRPPAVGAGANAALTGPYATAESTAAYRPGHAPLRETAPVLSGSSAGHGPDGPALKSPEFAELTPVGQLFGEFLVAENPDTGEYYIIDQHGAEERSAFEKLKEACYGGDAIKRQLLLLPERVETTPQERDALNRARERLEKLGFEIEPFGPSGTLGGETFLIKSVPELLGPKDPARLVKDLAEELSALDGSTLVEECIDSALMRIACHSVIRGPRALSREESAALLKKLARIDFAGHCPHGRPVVKRFSRRELEQMFKR
jgi:DNA mismatch repair protein MutL